MAGSKFTGLVASLEAVRMAVGPSAPPMMPMSKAQDQRHQERCEDAQLRSSAQQQGHGVSQQRTKVGHGTDAHKDDGRVNGVLDALIDDPHKANAACVGSCIHHRLVEQSGQRQVGQQHTKGDGHQQQGLKPLADTKIQQDTCDYDHEQLPPVCGNGSKAGAPQNRSHYLGKKLHSILLFITQPK